MSILCSTASAMANSSTETQPNTMKNCLCAFFRNIWLAVQNSNRCRRRGSKVSPFQPPSDTEPGAPQPGPSTDDPQPALSSFESLAVDSRTDPQSCLSSFEPQAVDEQTDLQLSPSSNKPANFEGNPSIGEPAEETQPKRKKNSLYAFFKRKWLSVQKGNQRRRRSNEVSPFQPPSDTEPVGQQPGPSYLKSTAVEDQTDLQPALSSLESRAVDDQTDPQLGLSGLETLAVDDQTDSQLGLSGLETLAVDDQTDSQLGLSGLETLAVDDQTDPQLGLSGLETLAVDEQTDIQSALSSFEPLAVDDRTDLQSGLSGLEPLAVDDRTDLQLDLSSLEPLALDDQTDPQPGPSSNKPANCKANHEPAEEKDSSSLELNPPALESNPSTRPQDSLYPEPSPPSPESDKPVSQAGGQQDLNDQTETPENWLRTFSLPGPSTLSFSEVYEVGDELGEGGFGVVFEGINKLSQQQVAIKFVTKTMLDRYITVPGVSKPLPIEVALNLQLNQAPLSPYIVHMIDWFDEEHQYILIMEYPQPCENFLKFITRKIKLSESLARGLLYQVVLGAKHCLDRGVFHQDFKLNNFLINKDTQQVKLIDFGCGDFIKGVNQEGFTGGCCPPEDAVALNVAEPETVWSLAFVLYRAVCSGHPFGTFADTKYGHPIFESGISREFQDLITRCLIQDPAKRSTIEEMLQHEWFHQGQQHLRN
ncbi:uncharacterized protein [Danio rerio]|uniref:non-specific serine/threonine protein kinase n=1 Tax=Danio rerio TaxID=7955 RepID=A0AB32TYK2_DANRE